MFETTDNETLEKRELLCLELCDALSVQVWPLLLVRDSESANGKSGLLGAQGADLSHYDSPLLSHTYSIYVVRKCCWLRL